MKIAEISAPWYPIPPKGYGGVELVVSLLTEELVRRGHDVTVFATGDSSTGAHLSYVFDRAPSDRIGGRNFQVEHIHALEAYRRAGEFDIIHDHDGMSSRAMGALARSLVGTPTLATLHGPADPKSKELYTHLKDELFYVAISNDQRKSFGPLNYVATIYNAIDVSKYPFNPEQGDYLLWLGRINQEKGAREAVLIAAELGMRLVLAGKMSEPHEFDYFKSQVKPLMGSKVEMVGELGFHDKVDLYRRAYATLFPIQWPEPFGLVMIESMATGTPVVATALGAAPEVIVNGETGYVVENDLEQLVEATRRVGDLSRKACREHVEARFSAPVQAEHYERAMRDVIDRTAAGRKVS
ncbi:MAG: glycosyltransferase family 4 protein [Actinobacteria bacterium]|nr:MAG: glycosyltransferase family 4 protein [Actinomycetota bacterium]